jgi:hypothetical protein
MAHDKLEEAEVATAKGAPYPAHSAQRAYQN